MKQTATPYTPRTVLATPVATLGTASPPKPPRKNARKCPADEDYSAPHPSALAHDVCAPATLPTVPDKPWVLTKEAETGKVTIKRQRAPATKPVKPRAKAADASALEDATFDDHIPLPGPANGQNGSIEKAAALLGKMRQGQSKRLALQLKFSVQKAITVAHKTSSARYALRLRFDGPDTMRIWRAA